MTDKQLQVLLNLIADRLDYEIISAIQEGTIEGEVISISNFFDANKEKLVAIKAVEDFANDLRNYISLREEK